jgi:hypothetical protein
MLASKKYFLLSVMLVALVACHKDKFQWKVKKKNSREFIIERDSLIKIEGISKSERYAFTPDEPVKLGVAKRALALTYIEKYFNSITGPNGEVVRYKRFKSCCPYKTVNSEEYPYQNLAVLEVYQVIYDGLKEPVLIYINFFDEGKVLAPKGFLIKRF